MHVRHANICRLRSTFDLLTSAVAFVFVLFVSLYVLIAMTVQIQY